MRRRFLYKSSMVPVVPYSEAQPGDIFCSDRTIVRGLDYQASGKVAIGVVFANIEGILKILARTVLNAYSGWSSVNQSIEGLDFVLDQPEIVQKNGATNTTRIVEGSTSSDGTQLPLHYTAAGVCRSYFTEGTERGEWSLFSAFEVNLINQNFAAVLAGMEITGVTIDTYTSYWVSQHREESTAYIAMLGRNNLSPYQKQTTYAVVRPYLNLRYAGISYDKAVVGDILCSDKTYTTPEEFPSSGKTAIGVVIMNSNGMLRVIGLDFGAGKRWGTTGKIIANVPNLSNATALQGDNSDSKTNTDGMIAAGYTGDTYASGWCRSYQSEGTSPGDWGLISPYEMLSIVPYSTMGFELGQQRLLINNSLSTAGSSYSIDVMSQYWLSAQANANNAWMFGLVSTSAFLDNYNLASKTVARTAIPVLVIEH